MTTRFILLSLLTSKSVQTLAHKSIVTNQSTETKGGEIEVRWVVTEQLVMTFGYSNIEVINLETVNDNGGRFSFVGAQDVPNLPAGALYGGALIGFGYTNGRCSRGYA